VRKTLITGGLGYVGGRLAQYLARSALAQPVLGSRRGGPPPEWLPTAAVVETAWHSSESLGRACAGVDSVVHLAGMNAQDSLSDPVAALEFNGLATARLLRAAIAAGVRRFVHISTAHVYGSPLIGTISEASAPTSLHPYATSHRAGEDVVLFARQRGDIEGVVLRVSNSFGPPAHAGANCWMLLVNDLCRQAVTSRHMVLQSTGTQHRDFVPLTDLCRAIAHMADLPPAAVGEGLYNVGGRWAPTIMEMAERIADCCVGRYAFRPRITRPEPAPGEAGVPLDYRIDKLLQTGFVPTADVNRELNATLEFCAGATPLS
jgi:UDP-glucose 4-epimerase